jgi:isopentenyldiphosphate isomerase
LYPDRGDISSAGHVAAGEEPEISALREIKEELGIDAKKENLTFIRIRRSEHQFKNIKHSEFEYIYIMKFDGDAKELKLQKEELQSAVFLSLEELQNELNKNKDKFVPHGKYWDEMIELVKKAD